ncbi:hypothetical protein K8Z61_08635 [Nocardioides sp. TRM66260-LWL]|uniref:HD domain-containing protein n=1 Tax=Nocardioides sp. TRM66260-LWL TaxID=2874478 RepID=UPI001CC52FED|nr:hypothetical protein [Nocardioides sp. TRM66260-LWL]MBZ5734564.1 hypothetical protein [Nocardioides sp. TRM66260-LWL]
MAANPTADEPPHPGPSEPSALRSALAERWPLDDLPQLRDDLLDAYADPARRHHDLLHLREVLDHLAELAAHGAAHALTPAVVLAAWFHDAVCDGERDAEERSAAWAEHALAPALDPATVAEVARLVRVTEGHDPADDDPSGCALSDADLAILAASPVRYDRYAAAIRAEFAHLDDATFAAGRAAVLAFLEAKPTLFHTPWARERWELAARSNLARERAALAAARVA